MQVASTPSDSVGAVVIGRNEGSRLERCLQSICALTNRVVYVDSGSTDGSVANASAYGVSIVKLDSRIPFTAARARNSGLKQLVAVLPDLDYVFFVDGDCEVVTGWLEHAVDFLNKRADVAVVCGRQREKYPENSMYNLLCDIEWDRPVGDAMTCGGNAVIRVSAFLAVDGYRADLICGEEPELCFRLRRAGWRIWRLDAEMTKHDAAILHFSQWWKRTVRAGYAFAQGANLHGQSPERFWVAESRRVWVWGLWIPVVTICSVVLFGGWAAFLLVVYPLQVLRLASRGKRSMRANWCWSGLLVLGNVPEMLGQVKYLADRYLHRQPQIIEYK
jgi:glycosyltransferase involved in cell wall biosynthesis